MRVYERPGWMRHLYLYYCDGLITNWGTHLDDGAMWAADLELIGPNETQFPLKSDKEDFIDCVKSRKQTLEPAEVGHRVTSLCHLGHIAIQVGGTLQWGPKQEKFLNNDAANRLIDRPIHTPKHARRRGERSPLGLAPLARCRLPSALLHGDPRTCGRGDPTSPELFQELPADELG